MTGPSTRGGLVLPRISANGNDTPCRGSTLPYYVLYIVSFTYSRRILPRWIQDWTVDPVRQICPYSFLPRHKQHQRYYRSITYVSIQERPRYCEYIHLVRE
jgi:hypothetical protein